MVKLLIMNVKFRRIISAFLDILILGFICNIPRTLLFKITPDNFAINVIIDFVYAILLIEVYIRKDCLFGYESLGKKLMGMAIYKDKEKIVNKKILMQRVKSSLFFFPLYPIDILFENKSRGDKQFNTNVYFS